MRKTNDTNAMRTANQEPMLNVGVSENDALTLEFIIDISPKSKSTSSI